MIELTVNEAANRIIAGLKRRGLDVTYGYHTVVITLHNDDETYAHTVVITLHNDDETYAMLRDGNPDKPEAVLDEALHHLFVSCMIEDEDGEIDAD